MFMPRNVIPQPQAAWSDFTPPGPWADGTYVTRNADGIGFTYDASINALNVNPNKSASTKNANNFPIINLPTPTAGGDAANKDYVDAGGGGGGIPDAPSDGSSYGRLNAAWAKVLPLAGGTMLGNLILNADPSVALGASTKQYVDSAVSGVPVPPGPSGTTPVMDGTGAAGSSALYSRGDHVHPSDTSRAPLASPTFTGTPAAPTATAGTNTTQLATTAFVATAVSGVAPPTPSSSTPIMDGTGAAGTATTYARGDHIHPSDTSRAPLASPTFTGTPAAPTPATADNSTTLATTAFVKVQGYVTSGALASYAPLASPVFTGDPQAPTPATGDNDTSVATTAFVKAQNYLTANQTVTLSGDITGSGATAIATTLATVNSNVGTYQGITVNAKGLVTGAVNQNYAPLASPTFTGTPAAPTATPATTSTTQLATTAFVQNAIAASGLGGIIAPTAGGTGIANNAASTITISGAFGTTLTVTATTSITLPVSGTLLSDPLNTGTSGHKLPYLDGVNTWSGNQTVNATLTAGTGLLYSQGLGGTATAGKLLLGNTGNYFIHNDASFFRYTAPGDHVFNAPLWTFNDANLTNPSHGTLIFGNAGTTQISYDGTMLNYTTGTTGYHRFQNQIMVSGYSGANGTTGIIYLGNTGSYYIFNDGANVYYTTPSSFLFTGFMGGGRMRVGGTTGSFVGISIGMTNGNGVNTDWIALYDDGGQRGNIGMISGVCQIYNVSDARVKKNIVDYDLSKAGIIIDQLRVREFDRLDTGHHKIGLITQEVEPILPEAVVKGSSPEMNYGDKDFQPDMMGTEFLMPYFLAEIKSLRARVAAQEQQIATLLERFH